MVEMISTLPLEFSPGEQWNYSVSTDVLGHLVEIFSGMKLDKYFQKNKAFARVTKLNVLKFKQLTLSPAINKTRTHTCVHKKKLF